MQDTETRLNMLSLDDVQRELSDPEVIRLAMLGRWLISDPEHQGLSSTRDVVDSSLKSIAFRAAPSIVVRGETELFGINMPRFAHRAVFHNSHREVCGFANLRRIQSFVNSLGRRLDLGLQSDFLAKLQMQCKCLADSFLGVPEWANGYHVVTTELARWYAEQGPASGTMFVTHFPICGGMCAQAVSFMATAMMHRCAAGVFGVAEVTMLASPLTEDSIEFLKFSGLDVNALVRYFTKVGLHANIQWTRSEVEYREAIRAYVLSDSPVVVPLDMRVLRQHVYPRLPPGVRPQPQYPNETERHVVLVVGAKKKYTATRTADEFLIHDPATFPYLKVSAQHLFEAAAGVHPTSGMLIPVTPTASEGPLLPTRVSTEGKVLRTGHSLVEHVQRDNMLRRKRSAQSAGTGAWCVVDLQDLDTFPHVVASCEDEQSKLKASLHEWSRTNGLTCRVWMHIPRQIEDGAEATVWINRSRPYKLVEFRWSDGESMWERQAYYDTLPADAFNGEYSLIKLEEPGDAEINGQIDERSGRLRQSLISSFCLDGEAALKQWPSLSGNPAIEYYVWMQRDVDREIERCLGRDHQVNLTAVDALASLNCDGPLMDFVLKTHDELTTSTIALATFIPEIAASSMSDRGRCAQRAIRFLGWLAVGLHDAQRENSDDMKVRRIELVAGSRIGSVFRSLPLESGAPQFVAEVLPLHAVHRNISENLYLALEDDKLKREMRKRGVCYAIEQEPGPLFALGTLKSLSRFCEDRLEDRRYRNLRDLIGLNVDCAHWRISGISPKVVLENEKIRLRIAHAHVSGHHDRAHFGDTWLDEVDVERFQEMMKVLRQLTTTEERQRRANEGYPSFDEYVSVEFEAAPDVEAVDRSLRVAQRMLQTP